MRKRTLLIPVVCLAAVLSLGGAYLTARYHTSREFLFAARDGNGERVNQLLRRAIDIEVQQGAAGTALIQASENGHVQVVRVLLQEEADANAGDPANPLGPKPLPLACERGYVDIVKDLLAHGADVEMAAYRGRRPIEIAKDTNNQELLGILMAGISPHK